MKFETIKPTDEAFVKLSTELSTLNERFDYEALGNAYNNLPIGAILKFEYKEGKMSIVSKQLEKRGLERGVDCTVQSAEVDGKNIVFVTRNTDKKTQAIVRAPKAAKAADAAAPTAGKPASAPVHGKKAA